MNHLILYVYSFALKSTSNYALLHTTAGEIKIKNSPDKSLKNKDNI